jgi:hypothetical protein
MGIYDFKYMYGTLAPFISAGKVPYYCPECQSTAKSTYITVYRLLHEVVWSQE